MERGTVMEINYKDVGVRVKQERINKNITQEKLAELSGVSVTHMSNIENANTKLSLPVLINISNALDCDSSILLFENSTSNLNSSLLIIQTAFLYSYFSVYHYHKVHTSKDSTKYYHNILIYHPTNHLLPLEQINLWIYIVKYLLNLFSPVELLQDYNSYCFLKSESAFLASLTCPLLIASSASANFFSIS